MLLWQKSQRGLQWPRAVTGRRAIAAASRQCCLAVWIGRSGMSSSFWSCRWWGCTFEIFITLLLIVILHNDNTKLRIIWTFLCSCCLSSSQNYSTEPDIQQVVMFIYLLWGRKSTSGGRAEREERARIRSRLQTLIGLHRAWRRAQTHKLWDHDLRWSRSLNRLSHPGAPTFQFFWHNSCQMVVTQQAVATWGRFLYHTPS